MEYEYTHVLDSDEQKAIRKRDKQGETTQLGNNTDKQNIIKSSGQPSVVLGYKQYQIGGPIIKSIGYYNSNGLVGNTPIPFNKFINAVNKINRMK